MNRDRQSRTFELRSARKVRRPQCSGIGCGDDANWRVNRRHAPIGRHAALASRRRQAAWIAAAIAFVGIWGRSVIVAAVVVAVIRMPDMRCATRVAIVAGMAHPAAQTQRWGGDEHPHAQQNGKPRRSH